MPGTEETTPKDLFKSMTTYKRLVKKNAQTLERLVSQKPENLTQRYIDNLEQELRNTKEQWACM